VGYPFAIQQLKSSETSPVTEMGSYLIPD